MWRRSSVALPSYHPYQERDVALKEVSTMAMELDALQAGHSKYFHGK